MNQQQMTEVLTVREVKKLLRSAEISNCYAWIKLTDDDGYNIQVSKAQMLETISGLDPNSKTNAIKDGRDLLIG